MYRAYNQCMGCADEDVGNAIAQGIAWNRSFIADGVGARLLIENSYIACYTLSMRRITAAHAAPPAGRSVFLGI